MKNHITQSGESQPAAHPSSSGEHPQPGGHHERFPTAEELNALVGDEVLTAIDTELAVMAHERHLARTARHHIGALTSTSDIPSHVTSFSQFAGPLESLPLSTWHPILGRPTVAALRNPRVNHRMLNPTERNRLNKAIQQAHQAGTYQQLAAIHANTQHRMHTNHDGTQRFLPWHRLYLFQCEKLLRTHEPSVRIPYWDYANDDHRPDWIWQPPNVNRDTPGAKGGSLPTPQTVNSILQNSTYSGFTYALEVNAHNDIHNWCNGTVRSQPTAAQDPIFWLLHANVDRIWNLWQATHNGTPLLNGTDAVLDPWGPTTAAEVDSVIGLGYWYRSEWHSILGTSPSWEVITG